MARRILTLLIIAGALLSSCKDPIDCCGPVLFPSNAVFVVCEGSLGNGNSALTEYDPATSNVVEDVYDQLNGHSLGDVFQSMTRTPDGEYLLCVNNSDRINVLSQTLSEVATISIPKPRYIIQVSATKTYVSTLFSNKVYVINPRARSVTATITMPFRNPEGMALANGKLWVACWDTAASAILPVDTADNSVGAPLPIAGKAPQEVLQDKEGMLWVLSGNDAQAAPAYLTRVNPSTGTTLQQYAFGAADPLRPVFNNAKDTLYFLEVSYTGATGNNGVYRMGIHDASIPAQAFVAARGLQYFWGIGIQPQTGNVYIADPKGFTQRGGVKVYRPNGVAIDSFATGVGPGHFFFGQ